jgi:hypothetical protein
MIQAAVFQGFVSVSLVSARAGSRWRPDDSDHSCVLRMSRTRTDKLDSPHLRESAYATGKGKQLLVAGEQGRRADRIGRYTLSSAGLYTLAQLHRQLLPSLQISQALRCVQGDSQLFTCASSLAAPPCSSLKT